MITTLLPTNAAFHLDRKNITQLHCHRQWTGPHDRPITLTENKYSLDVSYLTPSLHSWSFLVTNFSIGGIRRSQHHANVCWYKRILIATTWIWSVMNQVSLSDLQCSNYKCQWRDQQLDRSMSSYILINVIALLNTSCINHLSAMQCTCFRLKMVEPLNICSAVDAAYSRAHQT